VVGQWVPEGPEGLPVRREGVPLCGTLWIVRQTAAIKCHKAALVYGRDAGMRLPAAHCGSLATKREKYDPES
jgi:hypothetical protein